MRIPGEIEDKDQGALHALRSSDYNLNTRRQIDCDGNVLNGSNVTCLEENRSRDHSWSDGTITLGRYPPFSRRLPNTSFGISMGLVGHAIMWKFASDVDFIANSIDTKVLSFSFWVVGFVVGLCFFCMYAHKICFHSLWVMDEYRDANNRMHFLNMPHLIMLMLAISLPDEMILLGAAKQTQRVVWIIGFLIQTVLSQNIYKQWLFSNASNISCARPQFLLSIVGWFFLATLGATTDIEEVYGIALPTFCLGIGIMLYLIITFAIFNGIHNDSNAKGSPALFLIIAPPSIGINAFEQIAADQSDQFPLISKLLLGWCLSMAFLLISIGPHIVKKPAFPGFYWAYVFPLAALASATTRYASVEKTITTQTMAISMIVLAVLVLIIVFVRTCIHAFQVFQGSGEWGDPLLSEPRLTTQVQHISHADLENGQVAS